MRKPDLLLLLCSALLLLSFAISFFALPSRSFSEAENRALSTWRLPSVRELLDGRAAAMLSAVYADQFPLRTLFTAVKAETERFLGKQENNGVFFGADGTLIPRNEYASLSVARENLSAISRFMEDSPLPCTLLIAPRAMDVLRTSLPDTYTADTAIFACLAERGLSYTLPLERLCTEAEQGAYVWYRTDHHWTTLGAYLAYVEVAAAMGLSPYPRSYFEEECVSTAFLGTSHAKIGDVEASPDSVTLFRYEGDEAYAVTYDGTDDRANGIYAWEALEKKDHYGIFLGGNYSRVSISLPQEQRRGRLLLIKDSFANALVPFLALHFDLELVDLRYARDSVQDLLAEGEFDQVLIVQGLDTLATDPSLRRLSP